MMPSVADQEPRQVLAPAATLLSAIFSDYERMWREMKVRKRATTNLKMTSNHTRFPLTLFFPSSLLSSALISFSSSIALHLFCFVFSIHGQTRTQRKRNNREFA